MKKCVRCRQMRPKARGTRSTSEEPETRRGGGLNQTAAAEVSLAAVCSNPLGLHEMRAIDHLSIETHDSGTRSRRESGDDPLRSRNFVRGGHEGGVDGLNLVGMDGELARKTIPARAVELARESI